MSGAFAAASPSALSLVNVLLNAGAAMLITIAASRARRWAWLVMSGVAVLAATGPWLGVATAALAVALAASVVPRRRLLGALVGALSSQVLLRLPEIGAPLGSSLVAAAAVAPVLVSAYLASPRRTRRRVHRWLLLVVGVASAGIVVLVVAAALAYGPSTRAVDLSKSGAQALRDGRTVDATRLLDEASGEFGIAHSKLDSWWAKPAFAVPVLAQQAEAARVASKVGALATASISSGAREANYESLRYEDGRIDVGRLRHLEEPLRQTGRVLDHARMELSQARSPWLAAPMSDRLTEFERDITDAAHETHLAAETARWLPGLLGSDGPRRYLVLFTTPAEQRGLGGFVGNWAELTADKGRLELSRSGRTAELNSTPGAATRTGPFPEDFAKRYAQYRPGMYFQDVTLSPDMPTVARVVGTLYPQMGGQALDGVLAIDPYGIAALLELTGPIRVSGLPNPLTSANAAEVLVREQYLSIEERADRADALDQAGKTTFEKLIATDLPGPRRLGQVLGPVVHAKRIMMASLHDEEQGYLGQLSVSGAFPRVSGDFLSVRAQNRANNKVDAYLKKEIRYSVSLDPVAGTLNAKAVVKLTNDAPESGLPDAIIGSNDKPIPRGTNLLNLSLYTPHGLRQARVDGEPAGFGYQRELGYAVYSRELSIPAGHTVTVEVDLFGRLTSGLTYDLTISPQPSVNAATVVVDVGVSPTHALVAPTGSSQLELEPGLAHGVWAGPLTEDGSMTVAIRER